MAMTTALKNEIVKLARESVKEALTEELMKVRSLAIPYISPAEQKNIEKLYKQPSRKSLRSVRVRV